MLRIPTEEFPDRDRDIGHVGLVGEELQGPRGDPCRIHKHPQDLVHPIGVMHDAAQHQLSLVVIELRPTLLQGVPEALHRRERRADIVGGRGDQCLERGALADATARPFEQTHGCRRGQVQRFGAAGVRHADGGVGEPHDLLRQSVRLVPEHERHPATQIQPVQVLRTVRVHREGAEAAPAEGLDHLGGGDPADDRQVEERSRRSPDGLGVVDVDG